MGSTLKCNGFYELNLTRTQEIAELKAYIRKHVGATHCESSPEQQEIERLKLDVSHRSQVVAELQTENERLRDRIGSEIQRAVGDCEFEAAARLRKLKDESEAGP